MITIKAEPGRIILCGTNSSVPKIVDIVALRLLVERGPTRAAGASSLLSAARLISKSRLPVLGRCPTVQP